MIVYHTDIIWSHTNTNRLVLNSLCILFMCLLCVSHRKWPISSRIWQYRFTKWVWDNSFRLKHVIVTGNVSTIGTRTYLWELIWPLFLPNAVMIDTFLWHGTSVDSPSVLLYTHWCVILLPIAMQLFIVLQGIYIIIIIKCNIDKPDPPAPVTRVIWHITYHCDPMRETYHI